MLASSSNGNEGMEPKGVVRKPRKSMASDVCEDDVSFLVPASSIIISLPRESVVRVV